MRTLVRAVAVFCIACLCAELLTQIVPQGPEQWARRCIKAVAGLYILVVFFRTVPPAGASWKAFSLPQAEPAALGTQEEIVCAETKRELEQALAAQLAEKLGCSAAVSVVLEMGETQLFVSSVSAHLPAGSTEKLRRQAAVFLQGTLRLSPDAVRVTAESEEAP